MGKISVGSLAKTLGIEPKDAIARLKEIGVDAKTATSQVDEGVVARLTAPQPKDTGTNEVRVASNIIRRRAKVVPVVEGAETAIVAEATSVQPPVTPPPIEVPSAEQPAEAAVHIAEEHKDVAAVGVTAPKEPAMSVKPAEAVKAGPNQARILGMMEIPGVTNRPTRVVTKETPVTPRTAPQRPAQDSTQPRRPAPGADTRRPSPGYDQKRPVSTTPSAPATELDRSRMKQVQLAPAALPGGDNRRGGKKDGPGYGDAGKGGKKGLHQPRKRSSRARMKLLKNVSARLIQPIKGQRSAAEKSGFLKPGKLKLPYRRRSSVSSRFRKAFRSGSLPSVSLPRQTTL